MSFVQIETNMSIHKLMILIACSAVGLTNALKITNGPKNITVYSGENVTIDCGFVGAPADSTVPDWIINKKNVLGYFTSEIISSSEITNNKRVDLKWKANLTNANNSKILVGPVNETYNESTYQCIFSIPGGSVNSTTGFLTVIDNISANNTHALQIPCDDIDIDALFLSAKHIEWIRDGDRFTKRLPIKNLILDCNNKYISGTVAITSNSVPSNSGDNVVEVKVNMDKPPDVDFFKILTTITEFFVIIGMIIQSCHYVSDWKIYKATCHCILATCHYISDLKIYKDLTTSCRKDQRRANHQGTRPPHAQEVDSDDEMLSSVRPPPNEGYTEQNTETTDLASADVNEQMVTGSNSEKSLYDFNMTPLVENPESSVKKREPTQNDKK